MLLDMIPAPFCVISRQAETVLARVSIGRQTDIELLSEMDVYHTDRVGGSAPPTRLISRQAENVWTRLSNKRARDRIHIFTSRCLLNRRD